MKLLMKKTALKLKMREKNRNTNITQLNHQLKNWKI